MANSCRSLVFVCLFVFILYHEVNATQTKSSRKKKKESNENVFSEFMENPADIVKHHDFFNSSVQDIKQTSKPVLAYVTPWNNHGYDVAKTFGAKFTFVSPVWLQVKRKQGAEFFITGDHDIDQGWIKDVRQKGAKVVPRLLFDSWSGEDFSAILTNDYISSACAKVIVDFALNQHLDGMVIEIWSQLGGQARKELTHFIIHTAMNFKKANLLFILVIPPPVYKYERAGFFDEVNFRHLAHHVDYFSLMTYDYSNAMSPGPNSPLRWVEECVKTLVPDDNDERRQQILVGFNFYGNVYSPGDGYPVIGNNFISILSKNEITVDWDKDAEEQVFKFRQGNKDHIMYYPTKESINRRLQMVEKLNVGISIWEIGQGLDYFYDLF